MVDGNVVVHGDYQEHFHGMTISGYRGGVYVPNNGIDISNGLSTENYNTFSSIQAGLSVESARLRIKQNGLIVQTGLSIAQYNRAQHSLDVFSGGLLISRGGLFVGHNVSIASRGIKAYGGMFSIPSGNVRSTSLSVTSSTTRVVITGGMTVNGLHSLGAAVSIANGRANLASTTVGSIGLDVSGALTVNTGTASFSSLSVANSGLSNVNSALVTGGMTVGVGFTLTGANVRVSDGVRMGGTLVVDSATAVPFVKGLTIFSGE